MKNIYKKFIKAMEKSNVIMLERSGNNYFISNGHVILKISKYVYDSFFTIESPIFVELKDGQFGRYQKNFNKITNITDEGCKLDTPINVKQIDIINKNKFSNFMTDLKDTVIRWMKINNNDFMAVNNVYYEMFNDIFPNAEWHYSTKNNPLIHMDSVTYENDALILPINYDPDELNEFISIEKEN